MTNGSWKVRPAVWRRVKDVSSKDLRVSVIGKIIDKRKDALVLDDGTGKITARFGEETQKALSKIKTGDQIKVLGTVMPLEKTIELNGEIVQPYDVDRRLVNKVFELIYS